MQVTWWLKYTEICKLWQQRTARWWSVSWQVIHNRYCDESRHCGPSLQAMHTWWLWARRMTSLQSNLQSTQSNLGQGKPRGKWFNWLANVKCPKKQTWQRVPALAQTNQEKLSCSLAPAKQSVPVGWPLAINVCRVVHKYLKASCKCFHTNQHQATHTHHNTTAATNNDLWTR